MKEAAILDRACDVSKFASEDPNRHIINSVHFTKQGVEATDGMVLIQVPYPATSPEEWAPRRLASQWTPPGGSDNCG